MAAPTVRGVPLVAPSALPDQMRALFDFRFFNVMQSKCFDGVYRSADNFVLSSPTGSGKTVILELAICRLLAAAPNKAFKIVYQAPIKALCSERYRDWSAKFRHLGLNCLEFTGDSDNASIRAVQAAHIIITTPEKWDSVTRKWKDHRRLIQLVKLFLIDEVHILKEDRGACLEAIVSRMHSIGSDVRFIALSATVPNSLDIAAWLGRNSRDKSTPALREVFDESYRPVRLEKHVYGFPSRGANHYSFDSQLTSKVFGIIQRHSIGRPILIFGFTRKSVEDTAKHLTSCWNSASSDDKPWEAPSVSLAAKDRTLRDCLRHGVGFHHAGLDNQDRFTVERAYLDGVVKVICCTSTLAVGVNLPAHFVIVKGTMSCQTGGPPKELSDLEIMQMLGRAGRPQFDRNAIAVIMTRDETQARYTNLIAGQELLESRLHLNLVEHLNAEINLGTIFDERTAQMWLESTFLFVRLSSNPQHYQVEGDAPEENPDERARRICSQALKLLEENDLILTKDGRTKCTPKGEAMARYCIMFKTMVLIGSLQPKARTSEILSAVAQAAEFNTLLLRTAEKAFYKEINDSPLCKYHIPVQIALTGHKISLVIQAVLGGIDLRGDKRFDSQMLQFNHDKNAVFQHASRIIRCIVDCKIAEEDAFTVRTALALSRSIGARAWDDGPMQLGQIHGIGPAGVRKLASSGVCTLEDLYATEPHKIEVALSRQPPFGHEIQEQLRQFPQLHVFLKAIGEPSRARQGRYIIVKVKAEIGFVNDKIPLHFAKKEVFVSLLAELSDQRLVHFQRAPARTSGPDAPVLFEAHLTHPNQHINCYVACDDIAGTMRRASLDPKIPPSMFQNFQLSCSNLRPLPTTDLAMDQNTSSLNQPKLEPETFGFGDFDESGLLEASQDLSDGVKAPRPQKMTVNENRLSIDHSPSASMEDAPWKPMRLANGNWACNHKCKNKDQCKHLCCNEGVAKEPAPPGSSRKRSSVAGQGLADNLNRNATKQPASPFRGNARPLSAQSTSKSQAASSLYDDDGLFDDIDFPDASASFRSKALPTMSPYERTRSPLAQEYDLTAADDVVVSPLMDNNKRTWPDSGLETVSKRQRVDYEQPGSTTGHADLDEMLDDYISSERQQAMQTPSFIGNEGQQTQEQDMTSPAALNEDIFGDDFFNTPTSEDMAMQAPGVRFGTSFPSNEQGVLPMAKNMRDAEWIPAHGQASIQPPNSGPKLQVDLQDSNISADDGVLAWFWDNFGDSAEIISDGQIIRPPQER